MDNDEILGYIALAEIHNKETKLYPEIHYINIGGIYVKPKHRHKGVATYMLQYAEMYTINNNVKSITASVCFFNDVSSLLFSKNGFDSVNFKTIKRLK